MEDLSKIMKSPEVIGFDFYGHRSISGSVVVTWLIMIALITFAYIFTRNLKLIPDKKQNFIEIVVEFINNFVKGVIGHHWKHFAPYLGTVLLFLVVSNTVSIFSIIPTGEQLYKLTGLHFFENLHGLREFKIVPPTKDLSVTATLAIMTILLVLGSGIRFKKFSGWLKGFLKPNPIMLPFNILDYFTRILSLSLRLFGNVLAAFIVMELLYNALGYYGVVLPAVASIYFDLFDGGLQAYIFVFLSSIYIAEAVE